MENCEEHMSDQECEFNLFTPSDPDEQSTPHFNDLLSPKSDNAAIERNCSPLIENSDNSIKHGVKSCNEEIKANNENTEQQTKKKKKNKKRKIVTETTSILGSKMGIHGKNSLTHVNPYLVEEIYEICRKISESSSDKSSQNYISDSEFAEIVCKILNETNIKLFKIIVKHIEKSEIVSMIKRVADIQQNGGMKITINDHERYKTPGGVFIYILKNNSEINEEVKKLIFSEEKEHRKEERRLVKDLEKGLSIF